MYPPHILRLVLKSYVNYTLSRKLRKEPVQKECVKKMCFNNKELVYGVVLCYNMDY